MLLKSILQPSEKFALTNKTGKWLLFIVFVSMLLSYPYVITRFFPFLDNLSILYAILVAFSLYFITSSKNKVKLPAVFLKISVAQVLIFVILGILHQDFFFINRYALFVIIGYVVLYAILREASLKKFIYYNNLLITIQVVLGFFAFFLILFGVLHPIIDVGENYSHEYWFGLTCTNAIMGNIIRVAGYFDEPGAMATWGVFTLVFNKLFFENKKIEWMLIVGLCFTLSMAYFIIITAYFVLFYRSKIKYIIPFALVGLFAINYISKDQDSEIYRLTVERFMSDSSGHIDNNRDILIEKAKRYYQKSPIIGNGETFVEQTDYMNDNPYETLAKCGILGTFALYLPLLLVILKYRKYNCLYGALILCLCYMQRPFHIQLIHYLMLYSFFLLCYYKNKNIDVA